MNRLSALIILACASAALAADYQFATTLPRDESDPTIYKNTTAYLWVPPKAERIRAVVLAPANIIERRFCDDPATRELAAAQGLALLFIHRGWKDEHTRSVAVAATVQKLLDQLAASSGYEELAAVPWIPFGHSGTAVFCSTLARELPERVAACIIVKGALPNPPKGEPPKGLAQVPILTVTGEFEEVMPPKRIRDNWYPTQVERLASLRSAAPEAMVATLIDRGMSHVTWSPELSRYAMSWLAGVLAVRLDARDRIQAAYFNDGVLADPLLSAAVAKPSDYTGDRRRASWFPNRAMAEAWTAIHGMQRGLKPQMISFTGADGQDAPWWNDWVIQTLPFTPGDDGVTFTVQARLRSEVPQPFADAGAPLAQGDPAQITYRALGWSQVIEQTGPGTFRYSLDREGVNGRSLRVIIGAFHPGGDGVQRAVGSALIEIPVNKDGQPQKLAFPPLPELPAGGSLPLAATADGPLQPRYYVEWGPAEIVDGRLQATEVPVRAKLPIEVKVTAYQVGRSSEPKVAAAKPVSVTTRISSR